MWLKKGWSVIKEVVECVVKEGVECVVREGVECD